jgi:hypothetical protein
MDFFDTQMTDAGDIEMCCYIECVQQGIIESLNDVLNTVRDDGYEPKLWRLAPLAKDALLEQLRDAGVEADPQNTEVPELLSVPVDPTNSPATTLLAERDGQYLTVKCLLQGSLQGGEMPPFDEF